MEKIIVLDFGGQYAHLIANKIRRLNVFSEILEPNTETEKLKDTKGIIFSGGPASVYENDAPAFNQEVFSLGIPILGICYGHQLTVHALGGVVEKGKTQEYGIAKLRVKKASQLLEGFEGNGQVWMSHADIVKELPEGFETIASTSHCENALIENKEKKIFGLQFHPEVVHTTNGMKILDNFLKICDCRKDWTMKNYVAEKIAEIKQSAAGKNVFLLASGGVDSTVCLALLNNALGNDRVRALHIDNGFMRKNESALVMKALKKQGFENLQILDASEYFLEKTSGVTSPEEKRKIIGNAFIEAQKQALEKMGLDSGDWLLGQGTIYPDTIETGRTKNSAVIKTHHNRVEIIQKMIEEGKVIEPLNLLYKDEVREIGEELGLPKELVWRHPFPGPGLAVRALCTEGIEEKVSESVKAKVQAIAGNFGLESTVLPLKSVGVQGDHRTYKHPAVLNGIAEWEELEQASTRITNEVQEINRVVWLVAGEIEEKTQPATLTKERMDDLREADAIVEEKLLEFELYDKVWQFPVVLVPLDVQGKEAIILRPVLSTEAMTARFADLPLEFVKSTAQKIMQTGKFGAVLYDITHKPPGTIEWE
ncbi:MAG: glutamine-hydrolyzing GMP synthase [Candidatus Diapherotrites archaeon]|nr:glutamine-hydrolyzing GMP synthase [Candidatus Diapherotrites archaeon]